MFLEVRPTSPEGVAAEAVRALRGVRGVLEAACAPDALEASAKVVPGAVVLEMLPAVLIRSGRFRARLQEIESWTLDLSPTAGIEQKERARNALLALPGVVSVVLRDAEGGKAEMDVRAYVPRVSTARILEAVSTAGCGGGVRTETVSLRVEGWCPAARELLLATDGISGAEAEGDRVALTRGIGRGDLERLNWLLEGTGCRLSAL